jgi:hypothetical protein
VLQLLLRNVLSVTGTRVMPGSNNVATLLYAMKMKKNQNSLYATTITGYTRATPGG